VWVFLQNVLSYPKDVLKEKYDLRRMTAAMRAPMYWSGEVFVIDISRRLHDPRRAEVFFATAVGSAGL
jgi:hypothetical protein